MYNIKYKIKHMHTSTYNHADILAMKRPHVYMTKKKLK
jgi:hypothetical protein